MFLDLNLMMTMTILMVCVNIIQLMKMTTTTMTTMTTKTKFLRLPKRHVPRLPSHHLPLTQKRKTALGCPSRVEPRRSLLTNIMVNSWHQAASLQKKHVLDIIPRKGTLSVTNVGRTGPHGHTT
jgi:hypothetical protein